MAHEPGQASFAAVLRRHRLAAGLTQEALAERAGMSARGVQNLEGGVSRPYRESARRLAAALGLADGDQTAFLAAAQPAARQVRSAVSGQAGQARHNLPLQLTSFVGRGRELAGVDAALGRARLVTLTGPGGVGKTRLALELATDVVGSYPDGVWLVDLAPLADAERVPAAVASVLGVREQPGQPLSRTLVEAARTRCLLLLLDNCEHLLDACARLADTLVRGCPDVHLLATSRQPLGMIGEAVFRVPPLALAEADQPATPEELLRSEAARLFCERASAARPGFDLTAQNAEAVAQICRQLDGLPLALELAAAQVRWLGIRQLAERLDERFGLLTQGNRAALRRQQTLQATIDWSYALLDEQERTLFNRLSVFVGGWSLEAAEAVCSVQGIAREDVPELLARLVEQSLVQAEERPDGNERYRLLETLRQYGREKLLRSGEVGAVAGRHAECYLALAEEAAPYLQGPRQATWQRRLEPEIDNLRAALGWWLERGDAEHGLRMAVCVRPLWYFHGLLAELLDWLTSPLALPWASTPSSLRGNAQYFASIYARLRGEMERAETLRLAALGTFHALGDRQGEARSLWGLADCATDRGDYAEAVQLAEESLALHRGLGDEVAITEGLMWMGRMLTYASKPAAAHAHISEALGTFRRMGDRRRVAVATEFLGEAAEAQGDAAGARSRYEEALALYQEMGDRPGIGTVHTYLGRIALNEGNLEEARQRFRRGLAVAREVGYRERVCNALEGLAALAAAEGRPERALRLAGASAVLRERASLVVPPHERAWLAERLASARQELGEQGAMAAWAAGQALSLDEAGAEALKGDDRD